MSGAPPHVGLFVTCLVDLFRPSVGFATVRLLERAGCRVSVPAQQTCCGQPAFSQGAREEARALARLALEEDPARGTGKPRVRRDHFQVGRRPEREQRVVRPVRRMAAARHGSRAEQRRDLLAASIEVRRHVEEVVDPVHLGRSSRRVPTRERDPVRPGVRIETQGASSNRVATQLLTSSRVTEGMYCWAISHSASIPGTVSPCITWRISSSAWVTDEVVSRSS